MHKTDYAVAIIDICLLFAHLELILVEYPTCFCLLLYNNSVLLIVRRPLLPSSRPDWFCYVMCRIGQCLIKISRMNNIGSNLQNTFWTKQNCVIEIINHYNTILNILQTIVCLAWPENVEFMICLWIYMSRTVFQLWLLFDFIRLFKNCINVSTINENEDCTGSSAQHIFLKYGYNGRLKKCFVFTWIHSGYSLQLCLTFWNIWTKILIQPTELVKYWQFVESILLKLVNLNHDEITWLTYPFSWNISSCGPGIWLGLDI